jgi:hypothetical protein
MGEEGDETPLAEQQGTKTPETLASNAVRMRNGNRPKITPKNTLNAAGKKNEWERL